ncbi:MAG: MGH1-like glycoside hydrolase domain-containing protein [Phycisphaerae bacterium]
MVDISRRDVLTGLAGVAVGSLGDAETSRVTAAAETVKQEPMLRKPVLSPAARKAAADKLLAYIAKVGPKLLLPPVGVLRHPFISPSLPGKAYDGQLWDWDTLWTSRGLFRLAALLDDRALHARICSHAQGSLFNFLEHQSEAGRIPIMLQANNTDIFRCLNKAAPNYHNQAKPVFGQLALLVADEMGDVKWLEPRFDQLLKFYNSWILGYQSATGLLVWGDEVAYGDDGDPTVWGRPFFSSANIMLNSLYYQDLRAAAELAHRLNRPEDEKRLTRQAQDMADRIQKYCWDPRDRFYYTVDVQCKDRRAELLPGIPEGMPMSWHCLPMRIQMFTGFLPLWCSLATTQQADDLVQLHYRNDKTFYAAYGVRSLSKQETMYTLARSGNPSNMLGPIWIIVNYFVWKGLKDYGYRAEAENLADKTLQLLAMSLTTTGTLNEYYNPDTGAPISHNGFMDWNMLVLEMI